MILEDTFPNHLTAVRHGNGRDWWIAAHKGRSNRSLLFLLNHDGLHPPIAQHIGPVWGPRDWSGQSVFSPDGSKYARANPDNGLNLFDLDRCTGTFSNPIVVSLAADSASAAGVAFSPNSRFLYLSTGLKLFQFDIQAPNIPASKQLIGVYDGFLGPFPTSFYQMRLAPNGKIYMGATNGVRYLSYYEPATWSWDFGDGSPASSARHPQHLYAQPGAYTVCLTVSNQYGSDTHCKTLYLGVTAQDNPVLQAQVQVWPNPFRERFAVAISSPLVGGSRGALRLYDAAGRLVLEQRLVLGVNEIEAAGLPPGLYFWEVVAGGERVKSGKLVKTDKP